MMTWVVRGAAVAGLASVAAVWAQAPVEKVGGHIDLSSSKQITGVVPGNPQQLGSLAGRDGGIAATATEPAGRMW